MYKNPRPCLPEDVKYKKFRIEFEYKEAMTTKEAAHEFYEFLLDTGKLPTEFIVPNGKAEIEYQK